MIPNITRGGNMAGVVGYLSGPGNKNEHKHPMLIGASLGIATETGFKTRELDSSDVQRAVSEALDAPRVAWGREVRTRDKATGEMKAAHVWHCSLTLGPEEQLTDLQWHRVARQFVEQMKFGGCEWALIKHGPTGRDKLDHAHLIVNLVQTDTGKPARVHNDFKRAQAACANVARAHGLIELAGQQRHLPETVRREIAPRPLTQGVRYEIAKRVLDRLQGDVGDDHRNATVGLKFIDAKRGGAMALLERRDIAIPASDLQARIDEHMAALDRERLESAALYDRSQLSPAIARPATTWGQDDDHGRGDESRG